MYGARSAWYTIEQKEEFFLNISPGDLLEFKRNGYSHWGVYVGRPRDFSPYLSSMFDLGFQCDPEKEYVVHRANPGDSEISNFFRGSQSLAKGLHGIGNVILESLDDVWRDSQVRKNNGGDALIEPSPAEIVLERVFAHFMKYRDDPGCVAAYNLVFNNCEHFATYCRYGFKCSTQVLKFGAVCVGAAIAVGGVLGAAKSIFSGRRTDALQGIPHSASI